MHTHDFLPYLFDYYSLTCQYSHKRIFRDLENERTTALSTEYHNVYSPELPCLKAEIYGSSEWPLIHNEHQRIIGASR